jgi:hypothetical protein
MRAVLVNEMAGKPPRRLCRRGRVAPWVLLCGIFALAFSALGSAAAAAQTAPAATPHAPVARHHKKAAPAPEPPPPPPPTVAPSLFQQPAAPATVTAIRNELTVKADNSSLAQILHQVSSATGMRLDGLGGDERVFGNFGPGAPREVLTSLLNGTAYNVMMVGDLPNGAPRELLLTTRAAGAAQPAAADASPAQPNNGDADNSDDSGNSDDSDDSPPPMQYTPPSIAPSTPPPGSQTPQRAIPQMRNGPPPQ